jgi:hypothetical protein
MSRITIDASLPDKLLALTHPVELCDARGQVVGRFTPVLAGRFEGVEPQISEEEIQRRKQEGGGRKLAEIMADLEKRA